MDTTSFSEKNALIATVVFFLLMITVFAILTALSPGVLVRAEFLELMLVLLGVYLVFSGRVSEIGGWGITLKIRDISRSPITFYRVNEMSVRDTLAGARAFEKRSMQWLDDNLPRLIVERRNTLLLVQGIHYEFNALQYYLRTLGEFSWFRDVVFVDESLRFQGRIVVGDLKSLLGNSFRRDTGERALMDVMEKINEWKVSEIPGVTTDSTEQNASNSEVLKTMDKTGRDVIAVLDSERHYLGVVTRNEIIGRAVAVLLRG